MSELTIAIAHANSDDGAMRILDGWAMELVDNADLMGYDVVDISGPDLTYERMTDILLATKPAILFNFSYGRRDCLLGNSVNGLVNPTLTQGDGMASNLHAVKGIAVISYSNYTGGQLGQKMIEAGCPALVGFSEDLIVVSDKVGTENIFKDSLLPLSMRILEGHTIGEAVCATYIDLVNKVKEYRAYKHIYLPLFYNIKSLTLLGDVNWKLEKELEKEE